MTGALLHATSRTSLGLLFGIVGLPLLSLAGYFVADGLASDRSVVQVMLSLPVAGSSESRWARWHPIRSSHGGSSPPWCAWSVCRFG